MSGQLPAMEGTAPTAARGLRYMPGVDGLRAVAVVAVVIYHLGGSWLPGGYLGVDVFLVISGYLITSLLLAEHRTRGRMDLKRFWLRRARRLLPAVFLMIAVTLAFMVAFHHDEVGRLRGEVLAAVGYVVNWHFIFADVPYFEQFGRPSVFLHLWSLAIEEQFYLLWPPLLALGLVVLRRRWLVVGAIAAVAAGSTLLAWVLYEPFTDPSRVYYGTDTRAVALLVGAGLALVPKASPEALRGHGAPRWLMEAIGLAGAAGVAFALLTLGDLDERLYRGGFLLVALAAAGVVLAAADRRTLVAKALGFRPFVWVGLLSYSIYLWHWPVIMLTRPDADVPFDGAPLVLVRVAATAALAYASYRFVEVPFRRNGVAGLRAGLRRWSGRGRRPVRVAALSSVPVAVLALALTLAFIPAGRSGVPGIANAETARPQPPPVVPDDPAPVRRERLLFVGDSVMLGASQELLRHFGRRAVVDAVVGRHFPEGVQIVQAYLRQLPRDTTLILHLGNNDFIDPRDLDALLDRLARRKRIFLLTVRVPLRWQDSVNEAIRAAPAEHPNVTVIDWHDLSGGPGLLVDGAHMTERGIRLYVDTIDLALATTPD